MTTHELAKLLLEAPDKPAVYTYFDGGPDFYETAEVVKVYYDDNCKEVSLIGEHLRTEDAYGYDEDYYSEDDNEYLNQLDWEAQEELPF